MHVFAYAYILHARAFLIENADVLDLERDISSEVMKTEINPSWLNP